MIIIKLNKNALKIISIILIISLFPITSYGNTKPITIEQSFTYEDGYWKPGRIESKSLYINNNKSNNISIDRLYFDLKSSQNWKTGEKLYINSNQFKEFAKHSTVTLKHGNYVLFRDRFNNLISKNVIILSKNINISPNDRVLLNMTIDMDLDMNNDAQALNNLFTIGVSYTQDGTNTNNLPQTGGIINSTSLITLGFVAIVTGVVLNKKSKEGDEHSE